MSKRSFTLLTNKGTYGRYLANNPSQAASKIFSTLHRNMKSPQNGSNKEDYLIKFTIKETTHNSKGKVYKYVGNRIKLETPQVVNRFGKEITYHYKNIIGKNKP